MHEGSEAEVGWGYKRGCDFTPGPALIPELLAWKSKKYPLFASGWERMNLSTLPGTENLLIAVPLTPGPNGRFVFDLSIGMKDKARHE